MPKNFTINEPLLVDHEKLKVDEVEKKMGWWETFFALIKGYCALMVMTLPL